MKIGPLQAESETKGVAGFMTSRGSLCAGAAPQVYNSWVVCCMKGVALMDGWNGRCSLPQLLFRKLRFLRLLSAATL